MRPRLNMRFFTFENEGKTEALGLEVIIGIEARRNAVAFWTPPNSSDLKMASEELKKWAYREHDNWSAAKSGDNIIS